MEVTFIDECKSKRIGLDFDYVFNLTFETKYWIPFVSADEEELDDINFMTHGMNAIYIILDLLFVTGVPVRLYHLIHPLIAGVVYLVFTVIYDVAGGKVFTFSHCTSY